MGESENDLSRLLDAAESLNDGAIVEFIKSVSQKEIPGVKFCGWCHPDFHEIQEDHRGKWIESSVCGNHIRELALLK